MKRKPRQERARLLATGKAVAKLLKRRCEGTSIRIRTPKSTSTTNTNGWSVTIGNLGKGKPRLEIWLDRFSGYPERKLWACFSSSKSLTSITDITKRVAESLWPVRTITLEDISADKDFTTLDLPLGRAGFNAPILEKYPKGLTFYGMYDPTRETAERVSPHFCERAVAFFEDVARSLPNAAAEDEKREIYPQIENRKLVASHLHRERSKLLATECKIRDDYTCQVCDLRFIEAYGKLGREFAEAHHLVPLAKLREKVKTKLEDLATVCANCHRMLHKMSGRRDDLKKLRAIVRNHR